MDSIRPLYLHYLDRELRRAENANYTDSQIFSATTVAIIKSTSYCYCSASIIFESQNIFPSAIALIIELEKTGFVKLLANEHSYDEFISSRQRIYSHKSDRYPMYFSDTNEGIWPLNPGFVHSSTTAELKKNILDWIDSDDKSFLKKNIYQSEILTSFSDHIFRKQNKAITLDLILPEAQQNDIDLRRQAGRLISYFYTKRYIDLFNGDIVCNLPNISFYDGLSSQYRHNDFVLIAAILNCVNIPQIFYSQTKFNIVKFISFISHENFQHIQTELLAIISGLIFWADSDHGGDIVVLLRKVVNHFKNCKVNVDIKEDNQNLIQQTHLKLSSVALVMSRISEKFFHAYSETKNDLSNNNKILLVTATTLEVTVLMQFMAAHGLSPTPIERDKIVLWNFGVINGNEIIMVKTDMGSSGSSGSTLTIDNAIDEVKPKFVIMIGIAFGLDKAKQYIGDILISKQLENYESSKVMTDKTIQRADKISCGITLASRFEAAQYSFDNCPIRWGLILSGDKLVDSEEFITKLKINYPEAIGGEMEGSGLQSVCHRNGIEWILIKGICDWGFDKQHKDKDNHQKLAAENVCQFLYHTLKHFKF